MQVIAEKAPKLFASNATIVQVKRDYVSAWWTSYDRWYWCQALACKDLNWSLSDARLYHKAYTGRAQAIARCMWCLEDDHLEVVFLKNPHRPIFRFFMDASTTWLSNVAPSSGWHLFSSVGMPVGCLSLQPLKFKLVEGYGVLTRRQLVEAEQQSEGSSTKFIRNLMNVFLIARVLEKSSAFGTRTHPALDQDVLSTCVSKFGK